MLVRIQPGTAYTVRQTVCFMFGLTVSLCPFWAPAIHRSLDEQSRDGSTSVMRWSKMARCPAGGAGSHAKMVEWQTRQAQTLLSAAA